MRKREDLTGQRFGRLTVIEMGPDHISPQGRHITRWYCQCDCGNIKLVYGQGLKSGGTVSCGCKQRESWMNSARSRKKYNEYETVGDYVVGITGDGDRFIIDAEDYDKIKEYRWKTDLGYVTCSVSKGGGRSRNVRLHRIIMDAPKGMVVDHINHNPLDNRKCNLRLVSKLENAWNADHRNRNKSGRVGVSWCESERKWRAQIGVRREKIQLGSYDEFEDAVKAREAAEKKYHGEFSFVNSAALAEKNGYVEFPA